MITGGGRARPHAREVTRYLSSLSPRQLAMRQAAAERAIVEMGVTFTVYSDGENIDRPWPFDIIPRTIAASEWTRVEEGLRQRLTALNLFIDDVYNEQRIVHDGRFPGELLESSENYLPQCAGSRPPFGAWANICGSDLVRDADGTIYVLEDNLRVPSGVSYMLENRSLTKQVFPELFEQARILPVDDYPSQLFDMLASLSPRALDYPTVVVLTPGIYNSAYFEHAYLAQAMGVTLVEGGDLVVGDDECVYMRTIAGLERVDVIYRRVNDTFLDPECFRKDSMLGVPGLMRAWRAGNVALANAPGAGVADDKLVYAFVPDIIRYYLDEEPILPNVPTLACVREDERKEVLANLERLVVKPVNESGGYGMIIGPRATKKSLAKFRRLIRNNPRNYVAQPVLNLSTAPTLIGGRIVPRHLDLRPFSLHGERLSVTLSRLYKDGDHWKTSESFGRDDLPIVQKVLDLAYFWIFEQADKE
jgi:uncharacterized circularly permuted ATP-grasp superfamily protein